MLVKGFLVDNGSVVGTSNDLPQKFFWYRVRANDEVGAIFFLLKAIVLHLKNMNINYWTYYLDDGLVELFSEGPNLVVTKILFGLFHRGFHILSNINIVDLSFQRLH
jgi:hypothetical protein